MSSRALLCAFVLSACGGGDPDPGGPTEVPFGTTAIVVVVNPVVNEANTDSASAPGPIREGIRLTTDDDLTATTGVDGIAVLAPVTPGTRTITVAGAVDGGSFTVTIADGALHEVALATDTGRAEVMVDIDYKVDQTFEVTADLTNAAVNEILAVSDRVVFFRGGLYQGDLEFSGSRVTLFGEGALGGEVVLDGNVTVTGSDSRIRGTEVMGSLTIPASKVGLSFSRVNGSLTSSGSDGMLLANALCGEESVTGSGTMVLGNSGANPLSSCP